MQCPICVNTQLSMTERSGVEIDYCPKCRGVWLDRGELDKLVERAASAETSAAPLTAPPPPLPHAQARPYRRDDDSIDDDPDEYHRRQQQRHSGGQPYNAGQQPYPRKKRSWLGEILDFD